MVRRQVHLLITVAATLATSAAACGQVIPMPVEPEPTAAAPHETSPRLMPPPREFVTGEGTGGLCGTTDIERVTLFAGHYNTSDGRHFHRWQAPAGSVFWVVC